MRETLESVDKIQADPSRALDSNRGLEYKAKSIEDQVVLLQRQVFELKAQVDKAQAAFARIVELEAELKEIVA